MYIHIYECIKFHYATYTHTYAHADIHTYIEYIKVDYAIYTRDTYVHTYIQTQKQKYIDGKYII